MSMMHIMRSVNKSFVGPRLNSVWRKKRSMVLLSTLSLVALNTLSETYLEIFYC